MKAFLEELRTQHIYRIAAGYMVASWLILQIASLLCSALSLPNWTLKAILALLLTIVIECATHKLPENWQLTISLGLSGTIVVFASYYLTRKYIA